MIINEIHPKKENYIQLYKRMFPYIKRYWFRALLGILIAIPAGTLEGIIPFALKFYTDNVLVNQNLFYAVIITIAIPLFTLLQGVLRYLNNYMNDWVGRRITNDVKSDLYKKLLSFEPEFFNNNNSGFILTRFLSDPEQAANGVIDNLKQLTTNLFTSMALVGVLLYNSWQLAIVAVLVLLSSMIPLSKMRKRIKYVSEESVKVGSRILTNYNETIGGNKVVASYNLKDYQQKRFDGSLRDAFDLSMKLTKFVGWMSPLMYFIASIGISAVIGFGTYLIITKQITSGSFVSFITALIVLYRPIKTMGNTFTSMHTSVVAISRVMSLFDYKPKISNKPDAISINCIKDNIRFENVWFEYEEGRPVLKDININVKIGESLALVGNSGGGKSTFVNLIPRFYDVFNGNIKIDGIDIKDIELSSLRKNISVVFQDNFLFEGTIRENILLGKFDATEEEIWKVIKDAYLAEFVETLEKGLDTQIGERGVLLSGGQKQRIAIAREMTKNASIVILDEATSALDNRSEAIVQKALDKLMENKTVFVIAHRLSTVQNASRIAVINEGKIVEIGTHAELMQVENGSYKNLYYSQFKKEDTAVI